MFFHPVKTAAQKIRNGRSRHKPKHDDDSRVYSNRGILLDKCKINPQNGEVTKIIAIFGHVYDNDKISI